MFFTVFWIFLKIYQNMGKKLGSNNPHASIFCEERKWAYLVREKGNRWWCWPPLLSVFSASPFDFSSFALLFRSPCSALLRLFKLFSLVFPSVLFAVFLLLFLPPSLSLCFSSVRCLVPSVSFFFLFSSPFRCAVLVRLWWIMAVAAGRSRWWADDGVGSAGAALSPPFFLPAVTSPLSFLPLFSFFLLSFSLPLSAWSLLPSFFSPRCHLSFLLSPFVLFFPSVVLSSPLCLVPPLAKSQRRHALWQAYGNGWRALRWWGNQPRDMPLIAAPPLPFLPQKPLLEDSEQCAVILNATAPFQFQNDISDLILGCFYYFVYTEQIRVR